MARKIRTKYQIWDCDHLVPAYVRKPKNKLAVKLKATTLEERDLGIKWYIPYRTLVEHGLLK
jgi:hypothetical protein